MLNTAGEVIGITVAMLTEGQNLNFAVPSAALKALLTPTRRGQAADLQILLSEAEQLRATENKMQYSADASSEYQQVHARLLSTISTALDQPGLTEAAALSLAPLAGDADIQIKAAERAFNLRPSAEASFQKGIGLQLKYSLAEGAERLRLARQAADAFRSSIQLARSPEPDAYLGLGWALEETGPLDQAEVYFIRGFTSTTRKS